MKLFQGANVYVEGQGIVRCDVLFDDKIRRIGKGFSGEKLALPSNTLVLPGFIDQHIHGAGGADVMDGTEEALDILSETVAKEGVTGFVATTMTESAEKIQKALESIKKCAGDEKKRYARVLGAHLEGPFLSQKHAGAQRKDVIVPPNVRLLQKFAATGVVRILTLAVEEAGAKEVTAFCRQTGISASVGHSDATYAEVSEAMAWGLAGVTHTYNAQRGLHHREVGVVGAALLSDALYTEVIADLIHVSAPALQLLFKNKRRDKVILITDAMRQKGLPDGESELGGQKVFVKNGEARLADGTLAGSVLTMNRAVKNCVDVGVDICAAVDCATINPATNLRLDGVIGSIREGKHADFAVVDDRFNVLLTVRDGKVIYDGRG